ncbi:MAG: SnoaL-like domain-containing protein [Chloroflexi bacterium]|nr:SnoaL-like domain-containing protein [Chloroflexota bacterium]
MNKRETVQALMDAVQKGDLEHAKSMLADDFQFSGPIPEPINKDAWLEMSASLKTAFPDLDYHFKVIGAEGDVVRSTSQLSGTHNGAFDLTNMNMGVIPATNKTFSTKSEKTKITVKDDKITLWAVEPNDGAGLMEILKQLDIKLPTV